jgi:predicted metal-dependent phosphoesterase TrpH
VKANVLLCELHAHTTWSDGTLTLTELVDLYGWHGFDVLSITDHVAPGGDGRLTAATQARYLSAIERECRRALEQYGLLLIPGLELTFHCGPEEPGHALALGLHSWVELGHGLEHALREARARGAATVAAHPHDEHMDPNPSRTKRWFWHAYLRSRAPADIVPWHLREPSRRRAA